MQLLEKLRKAGIKPLLRDATMEEHAALVSYTEFESWWSAIYEGRRQLKAFETPHEHDDVSQATMIKNGSLGFLHHTASLYLCTNHYVQCSISIVKKNLLALVFWVRLRHEKTQNGYLLS